MGASICVCVSIKISHLSSLPNVVRTEVITLFTTLTKRL